MPTPSAHRTSSRPGTRSRRRYLTALLAVLGLVASVALAVAAPSTAGTGSGTASKSGAPTRAACPTENRHQYARCFALVRTDVASHRGASPLDTPSGYGPSDLRDAYNLPSAAGGAGQTVAIVDAFDNPNAEADLAVYRAQFGLAPCTTANGCFSKVNQNGDASPLPAPDPGWAAEISLDLDMVSAACPRCHILLVESDDNFLDNLATAVNTAVDLGAKYVSNSYGGSEDPSQTGLDSAYDHPGVAVTASTGDFGFGVSYPATAPGVTAVGGTSLVSDGSPRGWSETAWDGAGSGCSEFTAKPSFQHDPDCAMKSIADVSAVADPATGVAVYNTFAAPGWDVYGGTSVSSPLIASVYALAGTPVAGSNPESYPYARTSALNDVTEGSNGSCGGSYLCTAGPGYDGPTGLGTPEGVSAFRSGPQGLLRGRVADASTNAPIPGAVVSAGRNSTTTGADGRYVLSVPVGTYGVSVAAYGYRSVTRAGIVVADGARVTENFRLRSVPSVMVSGTVRDGSGHRWPLYAKIEIAGVPGGPVFTDPFTGAYSLMLPRGQRYSITATPVYPGYAPRTVRFDVGAHDVVRDINVRVASSCAAPGYQLTYNGLVQHFDTTSAPPRWSVVDNTGQGAWQFDDPGARGNQTGGTGNFAIVDSDYYGPDLTQDTELISPSVDLSGVDSPVVGLNSFYRGYFNSSATIDYTIDNGATWKRVFQATTDDQQGPLELALPRAAHKPAVKVRFHYTGEFAWWWQVDDVFIGSKACTTLPGGLVAGFVNDANTGAGVNGATVHSMDARRDTGLSAATPDDPGIPDGFYWLFSSLTGVHPFTATKSHYRNARQDVNVARNATSRQDFTLRAGQLTVGDGVSRTVTLGGSAAGSIVVRNTGSAPLTATVGEKPGTFQIAGGPARSSYAGVTGAPLHRVHGTFTPGRMTASSHGPTARLDAGPSDAPWQAITDYPVDISNSSGSSYDGKVYNVGGFDGNADIASAYVYDPATTTWTQLADMSTTREAPSSGWIGGKLYVTGGWGPDGTPTAATEVYDPDANTWTTLADNPAPHAAAGVAVQNGSLYLVGGCDASSCGSTDVEIYDPASDSWSSGPSYPELVSWQACGSLSGAIYCAGGVSDAGTTVHTYAFDGSQWGQVADLPADDWGGASAVANGQLLVSGGVINNFATITNEGWSYDAGSDSWSALPNSNTTVYRGAGACGFYKIGGSSDSGPSQATSEVLPGYSECGGAATDVTWLRESPTTVSLAPGASRTITVRMNSARVAQPGVYTAGITFSTDTPYKSTPAPITMTVRPPATWGKVSGRVSGRACDGSVAPIPGATVQIEGFAGNHTLTTGTDGRYVLWLDERNNPLTVIVAKDGYQPQTRRVNVRPGSPQVANFVLRPARAC